MLHQVIDWILPPSCPATRQIVDQHGALDPDYWQKLHFLTYPQCETCGIPFDQKMEGRTVCAACMAQPPQFDMARSVLGYDEYSKQLLLSFKHGDRLEASVIMVEWLEKLGDPFWEDVHAIIPVPLHWQRLLKRRYNQAAELGRRLSKRVIVPHQPLMLKRLRNTQRQGHLSAKARKRNVRGAFAVPDAYKPMLEGASIALLDDVYTTGSTVNACAKVLKAAGAKQVIVLTVARVVRGVYLD